MADLYNILNQNEGGKIAILIDPDKTNQPERITALIQQIEWVKPSFIFVGGSTVTQTDLQTCVKTIKSLTTIPVVLFPGGQHQISEHADGILFLSLISGRNPDFLIGHQVESAHLLKKMNIEVIPTGYMLIDGGHTSSVSYVSQTTPIPADQINIAVKTAIAGEMLGLSALFLDAGSGASTPVSDEMIKTIKSNTSLPVIVGGGIRTTAQLENALGAGADLVVIGNKIEENVDFLLDIHSLLNTAFPR